MNKLLIAGYIEMDRGGSGVNVLVVAMILSRPRPTTTD